MPNKDFDELPYPSKWGMDFGFTNDPATLYETKRHNNKIWVREWIYETGLINKALSDKMEQLGVPKDAMIRADSAEPKSIAELNSYGWNVIPVEKGRDSVRAGVNFLLGFEVYYTESSTNLAIEVQEYKWAENKDKEPTNEPIDDFNHGMDAIRYAEYEKEVIVGFA
jgi:phage terminase large subunit